MKSDEKIFLINVAKELKGIETKPGASALDATQNMTGASALDVTENLTGASELDVTENLTGENAVERSPTLIQNPYLLTTRKCPCNRGHPKSMEVTKEGTICLHGNSNILYVLEIDGSIRELI